MTHISSAKLLAIAAAFGLMIAAALFTPAAYAHDNSNDGSGAKGCHSHEASGEQHCH